jgi:hypothetical protein
MRKRSRRARKGTGENNSGESEHEARLAPLEERRGADIAPSPHNDGTLTVDTGDLKLPQDLTEEEEEVHQYFPIDPFVFVILCFSLIFILTIAYVIWNGWEPPR